MPSALFVVTEEGYWGEELVEPLETLDGEGFEIAVATPTGSEPVLDERSADPDEVGEDLAQRVRKVDESDPRLQDPIPLRRARVEAESGPSFPWDAVVYPGGHGTVWDVDTDRDARALLRMALEADRAKALVVCHAAGLLAFARDERGDLLVEDRWVTGFPNAWEDGIVDEEDRLPDGRKLPYWVQDEVEAAGANWDSALDEDVAVRVDGDLLTARGPASSSRAVERLLEELKHGL